MWVTAYTAVEGPGADIGPCCRLADDNRSKVRSGVACFLMTVVTDSSAYGTV